MTSHALVVPHDQDLLQRLSGRTVVVRTDDPGSVAAILGDTERHGLCLQGIWLRAGGALADVEVDESWRRCRVALEVDVMGSYRALRRRLGLLSGLRTRVYLSTRDPENLTNVRVLASLGVACAVVIEPPVDWDALADLATYALLGLRSRGSIEPMHYLARNYVARHRTDFGTVYFDDPKHLLHVDGQGRVALSHRELVGGDMVLQSVDELAALEGVEAYQERIHGWQRHFLAADACACCPGWRICLGRYSGSAAPGCASFFEELLEIVEQYQARRGQARLG